LPRKKNLKIKLWTNDWSRLTKSRLIFGSKRSTKRRLKPSRKKFKIPRQSWSRKRSSLKPRRRWSKPKRKRLLIISSNFSLSYKSSMAKQLTKRCP
jgi:hypothetical protein